MKNYVGRFLVQNGQKFFDLKRASILNVLTRHLQFAGGNRDSSHTINLDNGFMSMRISSPMHPVGGGGGGMEGRGRGHGGGMLRRDREMIGQTIKIIRGPYKGNVGIVKDWTPPKHGSYSSYAKTPSYNAGQTPMYSGGRTPTHGSQTPVRRLTHSSYGDATPLYGGSRTPGGEAWNPSYSNTPARHAEIDGYTPANMYCKRLAVITHRLTTRIHRKTWHRRQETTTVVALLLRRSQ